MGQGYGRGLSRHAVGLDAERQRRDVEKHDVLDLAAQDAGLDGGAHRHHLIGVDLAVGRLAEHALDARDDDRRTGLAADRKITRELVEKNRQLFILGGEHLITYGTYLSFPKETGYVVFDAHYDLRDEYADIKLSHASYLRRIVEEKGSDNILHVGARAFVKEELEFLKENKIKTISDKEIRQGKSTQILKDHISSFDKIYTSFDLDVLDPAFAPGVGNPEALGITSRELFDMIYSLENKKVTGIDIVELNPTYDNGSTASLAAKIMSTLMAMNLAQN